MDLNGTQVAVGTCVERDHVVGFEHQSVQSGEPADPEVGVQDEWFVHRRFGERPVGDSGIAECDDHRAIRSDGFSDQVDVAGRDECPVGAQDE